MTTQESEITVATEGDRGEVSQDMHRLWWLASYPKCGSTFVRMFINAYISGFPVKLNTAYQYVTGDLQPQIYQLTSSFVVKDIPQVLQMYYRPAVLMNYLAGVYTRDACLKTHHALIDVDGIPMVPSRLTKGSLYLIRDPRDVVVSFSHHLDKTIDETIETMANNEMTIANSSGLLHILMSWSSHVDSWTINNNCVPCTVVRFEDLVEDTDAAFRQVLKGLGMPEVDEERFAFAIEQTQFEKLQKQEEEKGFKEVGRREKFFRKGKVGAWKEVLTESQVRTIEENHGATMQRYGYEPSLVTSPL